MSNSKDFSFGDDNVARAYDETLGPVLFEPWARRLIEEHGPWEGRHVLDLASGTGIVARHLGQPLGPEGRLIAVDINPQMLTVAERHCAGCDAQVEFQEASAEELPLDEESFDFAVCQQGFQFFPDRQAVTNELHRVLRPGGRVYVSCWLPAAEVPMFDAVCTALEEIEQAELAEKMRIPFDHMPAEKLRAPFEAARFANVALTRQSMNLVVPGGFTQCIEMAYSTPIGPGLRALPAELQEAFHTRLLSHLDQICDDGITMGPMATHVLTAEKA